MTGPELLSQIYNSGKSGRNKFHLGSIFAVLRTNLAVKKKNKKNNTYLSKLLQSVLLKEYVRRLTILISHEFSKAEIGRMEILLNACLYNLRRKMQCKTEIKLNEKDDLIK